MIKFFINRKKKGNARVAGLQKDLKMTDRQYQICVTALFVCVTPLVTSCAHHSEMINHRPYIVAELPANLLLSKIGPNILMPTLLTIWGVMVTLQGQYSFLPSNIYFSLLTKGLVTSFGGLVTVRFFLGAVEGPMFPGIVLYLSGFYTRKELSLR